MLDDPSQCHAKADYGVNRVNDIGYVCRVSVYHNHNVHCESEGRCDDLRDDIFTESQKRKNCGYEAEQRGGRIHQDGKGTGSFIVGKPEEHGCPNEREGNRDARNCPSVQLAKLRDVSLGFPLPQNKGDDLQGKGHQQRGKRTLPDSHGKIGDCVQNRIQAAQQIGVSVDLRLEKHDDEGNKQGKHFPKCLSEYDSRR